MHVQLLSVRVVSSPLDDQVVVSLRKIEKFKVAPLPRKHRPNRFTVESAKLDPYADELGMVLRIQHLAPDGIREARALILTRSRRVLRGEGCAK